MAEPIAALPMYALPELAAAHDAWWTGLARHLRAAGLAEVPARLTQVRPPHEVWADPGLLLAQSCGYPLTHDFADRLRPVATPSYAAPGCDGPRYRSALVVRADCPAARPADLAGGVAAVNSWDSQSGCNALAHALSSQTVQRPALRRVVVSGAHERSLALVAAGEADLCAVDCVTHALLARDRPASLEGTRVLGWSAAAPGLPYVTRQDVGAQTLARLRAGLFAALADPDLAEPREVLLIAGAEVLEAADYGVIRDQAAASAGVLPAPDTKAAAG